MLCQKMAIIGQKKEMKQIIDRMPSMPIKNKAFKNKGNLRFLMPEKAGDSLPLHFPTELLMEIWIMTGTWI